MCHRSLRLCLTLLSCSMRCLRAGAVLSVPFHPPRHLPALHLVLLTSGEQVPFSPTPPGTVVQNCVSSWKTFFSLHLDFTKSHPHIFLNIFIYLIAINITFIKSTILSMSKCAVQWTLLGSHHHHPIPKLNMSPSNSNSPLPAPPALATTILFSVPRYLTYGTYPFVNGLFHLAQGLPML